MSHFDECNIKAWEGAENPPPWCNCQTIALLEMAAQRDMLAKCIEVAQKAYRQAPEGYTDNEAAELAFAALRDLQDRTENGTDTPTRRNP
jgi:hypothetical protein